MNNAEIVALLRQHERGQDYYDPVLNRTQWLCGCREWVYDHPQHVADTLCAAVDLRPPPSSPVTKILGFLWPGQTTDMGGGSG